MSWDLFSYSNTGEPKQIVRDFVEEVVTSLHYLAGEASMVPLGRKTNVSEEAMELASLSDGEKQVFDEILQRKVQAEKTKLWQSLVAGAFNMFGDKKDGSPGRGGSIILDQESRQVSATQRSKGSLSVLHRMEILLFLKRARAAYGRTALCLSGGAMMGRCLSAGRFDRVFFFVFAYTGYLCLVRCSQVFITWDTSLVCWKLVCYPASLAEQVAEVSSVLSFVHEQMKKFAATSIRKF